jgi:hypothetical protein
MEKNGTCSPRPTYSMTCVRLRFGTEPPSRPQNLIQHIFGLVVVTKMLKCKDIRGEAL